jgi:hypothetical protein
MQIIIVQSEIEQAIRNHINSLLNVKDGNRIEITLSATRGEDGFKATIDIVAADEPAPAGAKSDTKAETAVTASRTSVQVSPPSLTTITQVTKKDLDLPSDPAPAVLADVTDVEDTSKGAEPPADAAPSSSEPVQAEAAGEVKPAGRSLFAGLKKPVNAS